MNKVIQILVRRDGMTEGEAKELLEDVLENVRCLIDEGRFDDAEDAWQCDLGLEPDYMLECVA